MTRDSGSEGTSGLESKYVTCRSRCGGMGKVSDFR